MRRRLNNEKQKLNSLLLPQGLPLSEAESFFNRLENDPLIQKIRHGMINTNPTILPIKRCKYSQK